jgi:hypothetical protein
MGKRNFLTPEEMRKLQSFIGSKITDEEVVAVIGLERRLTARQLLFAVLLCAAHGIPPPGWLREKAKLAFYRWFMTDEIKSWNKIFGGPINKGKHVQTERRKKEIANALFNRIEDRRDAGEKISKGLFEAAGKEFGVSTTIAQEIYYKQREGYARLKRLVGNL